MIDKVKAHIVAIEEGIAKGTLDHKQYGDGAEATKKLHALKVQLARLQK